MLKRYCFCEPGLKEPDTKYIYLIIFIKVLRLNNNHKSYNIQNLSFITYAKIQNILIELTGEYLFPPPSKKLNSFYVSLAHH